MNRLCSLPNRRRQLQRPVRFRLCSAGWNWPAAGNGFWSPRAIMHARLQGPGGTMEQIRESATKVTDLFAFPFWRLLPR